MSHPGMMFFKLHPTTDSGEWKDCPASLQAVGPDAQSKHHLELALCSRCNSMKFCAPEEEVLAELVEEVEYALVQLAKAHDTLELFRQRLSQR